MSKVQRTDVPTGRIRADVRATKTDTVVDSIDKTVGAMIIIVNMTRDTIKRVWTLGGLIANCVSPSRLWRKPCPVCSPKSENMDGRCTLSNTCHLQHANLATEPRMEVRCKTLYYM
jgi:hypothetical protein